MKRIKAKRKAIVCDIDGVLLKTDFILDEADKLGLYGDLKWDYFYNHCNDDKVEIMPDMVNFWKSLRYFDTDIVFILLTARNEKNKKGTLLKLADNGILCERIYMRKDGDYRPAHEIKKTYLQEIMTDFDIICFIDDNIENCKMAKELGILALRKV